MNDPHMPSEGINPCEKLVFRADPATNLSLSRNVDSVLMTRQVVCPGEYRIAWFSSRGIGFVTPVHMRVRWRSRRWRGVPWRRVLGHV